jgi:hypothetical protein
VSRAEEVANAILYEGYILYPYRPSSVKNQQRWTFGVVYPPDSSEGAATMETQCLVVTSGGAPAAINVPAGISVKIRFLHLMSRTIRELAEPVVELPVDTEPESHPVQKIVSGGHMFQTWQEGMEQQIVLPVCLLDELVEHPACLEFSLPASRTTEPVRAPNGRVSWLIVREQQPIKGSVEVSAEVAKPGVFRITARLQNRATRLTPANSTRDDSLLRSFVSAHKILTLSGAEFVSLIDPPECYRAAADQCHNLGTFPVLAGEEGQRDVMLSSPIILYDYPQIAPESAGDLCDGTEIDEILSLRILTLTDEEKREMRQSDERGRRILERTESLVEEQWMKLHGVLRGLRPASADSVEAPEVIQ